MHAFVLHNPSAGSGNIAAEELLAALAFGGLAARYCSTKTPNLPKALREPLDLVVVAGGDGTVVKAIDHLRDRNVPIAILPLGAANNIAHSLGIKGDPIEIARAGWQQIEARRLDIGTAAGPWGSRLFVEAVGIGVLAGAMAAVDQKRVQGAQASRLACDVLSEMLAKAELDGMKFAIDGQKFEIPVLLAEIMNSVSVEPRLQLAPAAEPGDAMLDLVYLEPEARAQMLVWLEGPSQEAPPLTTRRGGVCLRMAPKQTARGRYISHTPSKPIPDRGEALARSDDGSHASERRLQPLARRRIESLPVRHGEGGDTVAATRA